IYMISASVLFYSFFFNGLGPTEISTLSLHDALPISKCVGRLAPSNRSDTPATETVVATGRGYISSTDGVKRSVTPAASQRARSRSEEHTSELQSRENLVCRLLLEKKNSNHVKPSTDV